jgi:hypothetical protein
MTGRRFRRPVNCRASQEDAMTLKIIGSLCGLSLLALGATAQAAEPPAKPEAAAAAATATVDAAKAAPTKLDAGDLAKLSGGKEVVTSLTDQDLTAINTGNTISAGTVGSGNISLSGGALSNFNGVGNVVVNTGHNNNLQSSMSVTVIMAPAAH